MKRIKQKNSLTLFKICSIILIGITISCGKEGKTGPAGPIGLTGSTGIQGIPGKDGAVILSGTGVPENNLGSNGDMYLDKNSSNLYGPRTSTGWGTPLTLKGENGQAGTNGSVMLSGTIVPTTIGVNGDYYLNKTTADLYGPKTSTGWGTSINLKGSANVIASTWINLKPWNNNGLDYYKDMFYDIPAPILNAVGYTQLNTMLNNGGVLMVYLNYEAWNYQIPITIVTTLPNLFVNWQISENPNANTFLLSVYGRDNVALKSDLRNNPGNGTFKVRYVLIPAGKQFVTTANLKTMKYEEIKDLLNLKD